VSRNLFPLQEVAEVRPAEDLAALAARANAEVEVGDADARKGFEHYRRAGEALNRARGLCKHGEWLPWLKKNFHRTQQQAWKYMKLAREWDKLQVTSNLDDLFHVLGNGIEPDGGEPEVPKFITLETWESLERKERLQALNPPEGNAQFNSQGDAEGIEWALWSWNPVTGCLHNCPYCYARDIAERYYDARFAPCLWPARLHAPRLTAFPEERIARESKESRKRGLRNVFVCSMADLFGRWVPKEWIEAVLAATRQAPRWNFLFLTKFPIRMADFEFPDNAWVGTTVDCQARVANAEKAFRKVKAGVKWLSCEPLIEPLRFSDLGAFQWIVLGGASRSSQTPEWKPPRSWVEDIEAEARKAGVRVYEKPNLQYRITDYPDSEPTTIPTKAPKALRYLPEVEGG
jgi:protein gp37